MKFFYKVLHFIFIIVCLIIQISFLERLKVFNINIDLVMVAIAGVAVFSGSLIGLLYGFIAGLMLDLLTGGIIGIYALIYSVNGFIAGKLLLLNFKNIQVTYVLLIFFLTEINLLSLNILYYFFNFSPALLRPGLEIIINPVYNIIVMFAVFPLFKAGSKRKEEIGFVYKDTI